MDDANTLLQQKPGKADLREQDQSLRARLRTLANHHSQAELARRTGISKGNVSRYLKSGRIPADWLQAVLREFGVNPAWLMLGEGEMLRSDVSGQAAREAGQLLELALKLNAVGHERLAALQGRERTKMVRALSDTLVRNEELRARMRGQAKPVFDKLLVEYAGLVDALRFGETREVLPALRQVERLAEDPRLSAHLDALEALQCQFEGKLSRQHELHNRVLGAMIARGNVRDTNFMRLAFNAACGLGAEGRYHEGARLANAVLLLTDGDPPRWAEDWLLLIPRAALDLEAGEPARGLGLLTRIAAARTPELTAAVHDKLLAAGYLTGVVTFKEVMERSSKSPAVIGGLMQMALWESDVQALERVRAIHPKLQQQPDWQSARQLAFIDAVLSGKAPQEAPDGDPVRAFDSAVLTCEALRLAGRRPATAKAFRRANEAHARREPGRLSRFLMRALFARQAFELGDRDLAEKWTIEALRQGYGCLRTFADEAGLRAVEPGTNSTLV